LCYFRLCYKGCSVVWATLILRAGILIGHRLVIFSLSNRDACIFVPTSMRVVLVLRILRGCVHRGRRWAVGTRRFRDSLVLSATTLCHLLNSFLALESAAVERL
jgi:hypothetical protein